VLIPIILGTGLYGRVDKVPSGEHVATNFFHIFFLPIVPLGSVVVVPSRSRRHPGVNIHTSAKSVLAGYLRTWALVCGPLSGMGMMTVVAMIADGAPPPPLPGGFLTLVGFLGLLAAVGVAGLLSEFLPAFSRATPETAAMIREAVQRAAEQAEADERLDRGEVQLTEGYKPTRGKPPAFRFGVQRVEAGADEVLLFGRIRRGEIRVGDRLFVGGTTAGSEPVVNGIGGPDGEVDRAGEGQAVTLRVRGMEPGAVNVGDAVLGSRDEPSEIASGPPAAPAAAAVPAAGLRYVECPHCGRALRVRPRSAGKTATCPTCSQRFEVP
jgi:hypothetical protein